MNDTNDDTDPMQKLAEEIADENERRFHQGISERLYLEITPLTKFKPSEGGGVHGWTANICFGASRDNVDFLGGGGRRETPRLAVEGALTMLPKLIADADSYYAALRSEKGESIG